ncbi:conserved hypothetical protein [Chaetomium globosum CBS 148.51]|uniref:ADP-ribosylation factor n=1 Tax=Chaetomium globosum (strain ATCC 6205 / CBS 148.51 / DSM 1962 / NBRC 6347 / NRRL 1970) TaxID=306901 RepID=Q2H9X3_CHAGB|nr:uncharacterized protein CHGG_02981 [Chaetomium globosum CBS 148.51]EAQ91046.1 conserved hypothetical protein [Chaetomium globosum CBS 148.51]
MYHLAKGLYRLATSPPNHISQPLTPHPFSPEYSVLLLGLDNAGKTTFHEQVKCIFVPDGPAPNLQTVPTVGQNVSTIVLPDMYLKLTDIGDGSLEHDATGRLEECRLVLEDVLQNSEAEGVPLLILANKQDREDCVEVVRIKEGLVKRVFEGEKSGGIRDSRVLPVSALTGTGVKEAVDWVQVAREMEYRESAAVDEVMGRGEHLHAPLSWRDARIHK